MKKISYEDYNWIGNKSVSHWIARMCKYELWKDGGGNYLIDIYVNLPIYILLCIPVHVVEFFRCAWDGGLKHFCPVSRFIGNEFLCYGSARWEKADAIYNKGVDKQSAPWYN